MISEMSRRQRIRAACCDESTIDADEQAELVTNLTLPGVYQSTFAAHCRWREFDLEHERAALKAKA